MREGFAPLFFALAMLLAFATFRYIESTRLFEAASLASEVENFLEEHRTESADHFVMQQKARTLETLIQQPNRTFLAMLSLITSVQLFLAFFRNPKGRMLTQKAAKIWTRRP